jgi:hypothetical protein
MSRLRQALKEVGGGYDESKVSGFDIACVPKRRLFTSNPNPRLLGRFILRLDREGVADAWKGAARWGASGGEEVCVLLMGTSLASAGELAGEIADQRRKPPRKGGKLTLIPVDARVGRPHAVRRARNRQGAPGPAQNRGIIDSRNTGLTGFV